MKKLIAAIAALGALAGVLILKRDLPRGAFVWVARTLNRAGTLW